MGFWDFLPWVGDDGGSDRQDRPAPVNRKRSWSRQSEPDEPRPVVPGPRGPQGRSGSGYASGPQGVPAGRNTDDEADVEALEATVVPGSKEAGGTTWAGFDLLASHLDPGTFDPDSLATYEGYSYRLNNDQMAQLGVEDRNRVVGPVRTAVYTPEAWAALSPVQQDAARFNQLLLDARERDLGMDTYNFARGDYDEQVGAMFDDGLGTSRDLINIANLLDAVGFRGGSVVDIDEFASMERAFTADEINALNDWDGGFNLEVTVTPGEEYKPSNRDKARRREGMGSGNWEDAPDTTNFAELRGAENMNAIDYNTVELAGEFIRSAMSGNPNAWGWNVAARSSLGLGMPENRPLGYAADIEALPEGERRDLEERFQGSWMFLKDPETDVNILLNDMNSDPLLSNPDTQSALWDYIARRIAYEEQSGGSGGRSAEEIRRLLGWEG